MGTEPDVPLPDQPQIPEPAAVPASISATSASATSALKILVVEDNLTNQKVIVRQLQSLGYTVDLASNGQSAVDATLRTPYSIILMDCRLPKMDGYTATRLIRQQEQANQTEPAIIIALTASDAPEAEAEARAAGMNAFLPKPLRREALAQMLETWSRTVLQTQNQPPNQPLNLPVPAPIAEPSASAPAKDTLSHPNPHLNFDRLHQLSDYNADFEQELLQLYCKDTEDQVYRLRQALEQQNSQHIQQIAHRLRGASANIGATQLEQLAIRLEQAAQDPEAAQTVTQQLEQAFTQMQQFL